jgi:serine/threonine-protein kinase
MRRGLIVLLLGFWCFSVALASGASKAVARDNWGAIAYSNSTGRAGYSYDYATQADAINSAVQRCGVRDCRAVVWFVNGCGAYAKGDNNSYGWGTGTSRAVAESNALAECRKRGGGCRIIQWTCTTR